MVDSLFDVSFASNLRRYEVLLDDISKKQLPFAIRRALTDTAREVATTITDEIPGIFGKATPFTRRSIAALSAGAGPDPKAYVIVKDLQAQYLLHEEIGGTRTPAENTRKTAAALILPGKTLKLNRFGNIPNGQIAKLMQQSQAAAERAGQGGPKGRGNKGVIYLKASQVPARFAPIGGFFRRGPGGTLHRLTTFKAATTYRPKFGFRQRFERHASQTFDRRMRVRFVEAMRTAR